MNYPHVIIPQGVPDVINEPALNFDFEPDDFQKHAFSAIEANTDVLVCAPTASGKTLVAQYAIAHTIKKGLKVIKVIDSTEDTACENASNNASNNVLSRVVYTTPIKVLSNQNYADLKLLLNPMDMTVGISTGDIKIDEESQCLVATAEILRNSMYQLNQNIEDSRKKIDKNFADSIGCIIVDEAHYMNDKERGRIWEETIVLANPNVLMIFLSATLSNPEKFASWISKCRERPITLITVEQRKVPLKHHLLINNVGIEALESNKKLYQFMNEKNVYDHNQFTNAYEAHNKWIKEQQKKGKPIYNPNDIPNTVRWLRDNDLLQAMFFCFSKKECENYANIIEFNLIDHEDSYKVETIFNKYMLPHAKKYHNVDQVNVIKKLLLKGVAYHHSGMLSILKEIVEIIFKEGLAKVLFCTETFAVGINCPTRTVVFTGIEKYSDSGKRLITPAEYKQMAGRAGRRGLDTNGTVIILFTNKFPDEDNIKKIVCGKVPEITSNFKWDYQFFLKIIQSNVTNIELFFKKSLINLENEIMLNNLNIQKKKLLCDIDDLNNIIQTTNKNNDKDTEKMVNKLIGFENKLQSDMFGFGVTVTLPKKEQQEFQKLTKMLSVNDFKSIYDKKKQLDGLCNSLKILESDIFKYESYVSDFCCKLKNLLYKWEYITTCDDVDLNSSHVNVKGVIAGNINECNPIILTEIICEGLLDDLSLEEIIGFLSIFTEPIKTSHDFDKNELTSFDGTGKIKFALSKILNIINIKQSDEDKIFGVGNNVTDWKISTDYIDIAYAWGRGECLGNILGQLDELEEYEGNFVKNMLKISNIINDVQSICKMIGKNELLPVLENSDNLILRDIVSVTSLYLK